MPRCGWRPTSPRWRSSGSCERAGALGRRKKSYGTSARTRRSPAAGGKITCGALRAGLWCALTHNAQPDRTTCMDSSLLAEGISLAAVECRERSRGAWRVFSFAPCPPHWPLSGGTFPARSQSGPGSTAGQAPLHAALQARHREPAPSHDRLSAAGASSAAETKYPAGDCGRRGWTSRLRQTGCMSRVINTAGPKSVRAVLLCLLLLSHSFALAAPGGDDSAHLASCPPSPARRLPPRAWAPLPLWFPCGLSEGGRSAGSPRFGNATSLWACVSCCFGPSRQPLV
jgi:hypothetical protein